LALSKEVFFSKTSADYLCDKSLYSILPGTEPMGRVIPILLIALALHLVISFTFILDPPFLNGTKLSRIYKTFLLPGPFFRDDRIIDSYSQYLSWKIDGQWTTSLNPAANNFHQYHSTLNPTHLYRSRLDRFLTSRLFKVPDLSSRETVEKSEFVELKEYLSKHYLPLTADSIRIIIINKQAKGFSIKIDSTHLIIAR